MTRKKILTVTPGNVVRLFSEEESAQLVNLWISTFGKDHKGLKDEQFLWHIFSYNHYPSTEGDEALKQYSAQFGTEFIVLSNDRKIAFLTDQLPDSTSLYDYYVFPPNFAWTMAFTHEAGWLGPYFARHPDPNALDRANEVAVGKAMEAELARKNGWA
ncbi:hypothetical protein JCM14076_11250 [Methylosoma difficile]